MENLVTPFAPVGHYTLIGTRSFYTCQQDKVTPTKAENMMEWARSREGERYTVEGWVRRVDREFFLWGGFTVRTWFLPTVVIVDGMSVHWKHTITPGDGHAWKTPWLEGYSKFLRGSEARRYHETVAKWVRAAELP